MTTQCLDTDTVYQLYRTSLNYMPCYKNLLSLNVYYVHNFVGIHAQKCLPEFVRGARTALTVDGTEIT